MSLVVTSSSQQDYDRDNQVKIGLENPSSYQNFLKSPLIINANTEVALVSLKCIRDEDTVVIEEGEGEGFFVYWGAEDSENYDGQGEYPHAMDDINTPLRIEVEEGTYTRLSFVNHIQARLDDVVKKAYKEIKTIKVSEYIDSNNLFLGFQIQFIQHGEGKGFTDKPSPAEFGAYIDSGTFLNIKDEDTYDDTEQYTDNGIASSSGTDALITGYNVNATTTSGVCDFIGRAHPLSLVNGKCEIYFNGSSAKDVATPDGYTLGLVRSQGFTDAENASYQVGTVGGLGSTWGDPVGVNIPTKYGDGTGDDEHAPFFWDVAFNWEPGKDGQVIHYINDGVEEETEGIMSPITLKTVPTNTSLVAKYWDRVVFEVKGEGMVVSLGLSGSATLTELVNSASATFGERVKPLGITCNQLYPKIAIHNNDTTTPGTAWLKTWTGHDDQKTSYYENNFYGYCDLDSPSLPFDQWMEIFDGGIDGIPLRIDLSSIYADGKTMPDEDGNTSNYVYKGLLASSVGIAYNWVLITNDFQDPENGNLASYFTTPEQAGTISDNGRLGNILGLEAVVDQSQYGIIAAGGADVTFRSTSIPDYIPQESMFVRLKNMAINSYNANKQSISNIIYACPKFDSLGNTGGQLFYEPSERVYVKLNNPERMIVNSLALDIVNVNEQVLEELVGNTLIVLHFREVSSKDVAV
tara:strand:- start:1135 stop:3207 length:2073 start_codon:yes stop_codon:yes gene_type:complete